jgi:hypothetical protein
MNVVVSFTDSFVFSTIFETLFYKAFSLREFGYYEKKFFRIKLRKLSKMQKDRKMIQQHS